MTIAEWLHATQTRLSRSSTPLLDAEVLLCYELGVNKAWLLSHPETLLQGESLQRLEGLADRRVEHEPMAYIRGKQEFFGRDFIVNKSVLVPRPESEAIIELLKKHTISVPHLRVADVGTGSGALGITLALELATANVDLYDIDTDALATARLNLAKHEVEAGVYASNLLEQSHGTYDVICANLPYVPIDYDVNIAATHEPAVALYGGSDGLDLYRTMFLHLHSFTWSPQYVCTESLVFQHDELRSIATEYGYELRETSDLAQLFTPRG